MAQKAMYPTAPMPQSTPAVDPSVTPMSPDSYHSRAQKFIKGAKRQGMKVQAEGSELIAYPKGSKAKRTK